MAGIQHSHGRMHYHKTITAVETENVSRAIVPLLYRTQPSERIRSCALLHTR